MNLVGLLDRSERSTMDDAMVFVHLRLDFRGTKEASHAGNCNEKWDPM